MTAKCYSLIDHTSDFGMLIHGADPSELFTHAARALFDVIGDFGPLTQKHRRIITVQGADWPDLMISWLRELLYLWNGQQQIVAGVTIQSISETRLEAEVATDDLDVRRHAVENEIKAVTYHQIEVAPHARGWRARVIFDI